MTKKQDPVLNVEVAYIGMMKNGYVPTVVTQKKTEIEYKKLQHCKFIEQMLFMKEPPFVISTKGGYLLSESAQK